VNTENEFQKFPKNYTLKTLRGPTLAAGFTFTGPTLYIYIYIYACSKINGYVPLSIKYAYYYFKDKAIAIQVWTGP
jgi:hypothetical protein